MQVYKGILLMDGVGFDSNIYLIDKELLVDTGTGIFFTQIKEEFENLISGSSSNKVSKNRKRPRKKLFDLKIKMKNVK